MSVVSDVLSMSDDDFLKMGGPTDVTVVETPQDLEPVLEPVLEQEAPLVPATADNADEPQTDLEKEPDAELDNPLAKADELLTDKDKQAPAVTAKDSKEADKAPLVPAVTAVTADAKDTPAAPAPVTSADKEAFYDKVMTGFKANGKQIELRSPEELIQLAQMGANYTSKMQQIAPHRKMLLMLENNGLLDEGKLSYLIDLEKKDPEAIKKLIKDSGMNPLDIDTEVEPTYREGNHRVDDKEVNFRTALDDMRSNPKGIETLQVLNSTWDQASKDALFENPGIMPIMLQQRELGVYDRIAAEIDRQKMLGAIPATKSFVESYQQVGKQMAADGALADLEQTQAPAQQPVAPVQPVATRAAAPKATVVHSDKASAAAPTRTTPRQAKVLVNPLEMSDDEFLKQMNGRL